MRILKYSNRQLRRALHGISNEMAKMFTTKRYLEGEVDRLRGILYPEPTKEVENDAGGTGAVVDAGLADHQADSQSTAEAVQSAAQ